MTLIKPSVELLKQDYTLDGIYKQIELAGRTCYKSFDKITSDSAKEFVDRMIKSGHLSVLEHGTVYLGIPNLIENEVLINKYKFNKYSVVVSGASKFIIEGELFYMDVWCITTNYRVLIENEWLDDLKYLCEPTEFHEKRITVKFTTDIATSREFMRHRAFSFCQESTRYCNYTKDRFDNNIRFIIPTWVDIPEGRVANLDNDWCDVDTLTIVKHYDKDAIDYWLESCSLSESYYITLVTKGCKPQQARQVLSLSTCAPFVMTGFESDWDHFFKLRCSSAAHPDAQYLANMCKDLIKNNNNDRNS